MTTTAVGGAWFAPGRRLVATLDRGTDLQEELERLALENDLALCEVTGIGSLAASTVTYYDQASQTDRELVFERPLMLLGLSGTVLRADDGMQAHCHLVLGDASGEACGGDLSPGCVVFSCEVVLTELVGPAAARVEDEATGLSHFVFGEADEG